MAFKLYEAKRQLDLNILYVEFDWSTEIRAARQTVSERLSTLEGLLPTGISPQMTPPSSIMGQIVVAGIYRQAGPEGGVLAPVGRTKLMAELIESESSSSIKLWRVVDRRELKTWQPVSFELIEPLQEQGNGNSSFHRAKIKTDSGFMKFDSNPKQRSFWSFARLLTG
jgi:hypothetical protein